MSSLLDHAKTELKLIGAFDKENDFYGGMTGDAVMELVELFEKQNHSGMSASLVISLFSQVAAWGILTPVEDTPEEWVNTFNDTYQHKRCSGLFRDGLNGNPYFIDAIIFKEHGKGSFTGNVQGVTSSQFVKFPFIPKSFEVRVYTDRKGNHNILNRHDLIEPGNYYNYIRTRDFTIHEFFLQVRSV